MSPVVCRVVYITGSTTSTYWHVTLRHWTHAVVHLKSHYSTLWWTWRSAVITRTCSRLQPPWVDVCLSSLLSVWPDAVGSIQIPCSLLPTLPGIWVTRRDRQKRKGLDLRVAELETGLSSLASPETATDRHTDKFRKKKKICLSAGELHYMSSVTYCEHKGGSHWVVPSAN